jgi:hypothetical protein
LARASGRGFPRGPNRSSLSPIPSPQQSPKPSSPRSHLRHLRHHPLPQKSLFLHPYSSARSRIRRHQL